MFAESGYAAASTRAVARRARVPFGALHYHWGSKRELWEAVWRRMVACMRETVLANVAPSGSPGEIIDKLTDAFLDLMVADPNWARLFHLVPLERGEPPMRGLRDIMQEQADFGVAVLRRALPDVDLDAPATILLMSNAFVAAVVDVDGQRSLLGGDIYESRAARERLRVELRRVGRAVFKVPA